MMKKLQLTAITALLFVFWFSVYLLSASPAAAYTIGGGHATLVKCEYAQYGATWGYVGTYRDLYGEYYRIFFGDTYCPH